MPNLPEPVRHPSVVKAAVSPTAVAVTAAGVVIGLLAQSIVLAIVLGAVAWAGRMIAAIIMSSRRRRAAMPKPAVLDPYSVPEPWRQLVRQAGDAQDRFDKTVADWPAGPIRDRLLFVQPRLWDDVGQVGMIATRGAALSGWSGGVQSSGRPTAEQLADQLRRTEDERRRLGPDSQGRAAALERTEEAIAAQIRAVHSAADAEARVLDRLRTIVARLDQTVTSLLLLGVEGGATQAQALESSLDEIRGEITSLTEGLAETTAVSGDALAAIPPARRADEHPGPPPASPTP
jgi:hypothetical protein